MGPFKVWAHVRRSALVCSLDTFWLLDWILLNCTPMEPLRPSVHPAPGACDKSPPDPAKAHCRLWIAKLHFTRRVCDLRAVPAFTHNFPTKTQTQLEKKAFSLNQDALAWDKGRVLVSYGSMLRLCFIVLIICLSAQRLWNTDCTVPVQQQAAKSPSAQIFYL